METAALSAIHRMCQAVITAGVAPSGDDFADRVVVNESVRFGKPVIRGTRVAVEEIEALASQGKTLTEIAEEFGIEQFDAQAALQYAAKAVSNELWWAE